jgi:GNAT superfamily N-acetyltransferase
MALATWWSGDLLPPLAPLPDFRAGATTDTALVARLAALDPAEVADRLAGGHRPYIATLGDAPAAYGWVAGAGATIGELGVSFTLPRGDRYLWDFATLPAWRGRGTYPHLLQAIIAAESPPAARLWIIHAPENPASARGIVKAGFAPVGELSFRAQGGAGFRPFDDPVRARVGAALLGVPLLDAAGGAGEPLAHCWHCAIEAARQDLPPAAAACFSEVLDDRPCTCGAAAGSAPAR